MPIYAYRCASCGHAKDVLQKLSDPLLTTCPQCGAETFTKQVTAAGFQLKGSGWYVTDFKGGNSGAAVPPVANAAGEAKGSDGNAAAPAASAPADSSGKASSGGSSSDASSAKPASTPPSASTSTP